MNKNRDDTRVKLANAAPMLAAIGEELSFTKAAERLGVDQSAVSHRAKYLEEALGHRLFERTTRTLRLTEIGEILCHTAIETIDSWDKALDKIERSQVGNVMQLSMPSSLAMKWLIPALPKAQAAGLKISVEVNEQTIGFQANEADAAIRFGRGPYPGLHSTHLSHCWLQPVAGANHAPELNSGALVPGHADTPFLADRVGESDGTEFSWRNYFEGIGAATDDFVPDHLFDRAELMLQAAISGMGTALGRTLLIERDIKAGYLTPLGEPVPMRAGYWLVCSYGFAETERHQKVLKWLKNEVADSLSASAT